MLLLNEQQKAGLEGCWCPQKGQYIVTCNKTDQISFDCFALQLHEHFERLISSAFSAVQGISKHVNE